MHVYVAGVRHLPELQRATGNACAVGKKRPILQRRTTNGNIDSRHGRDRDLLLPFYYCCYRAHRHGNRSSGDNFKSRQHGSHWHRTHGCRRGNHVADPRRRSRSATQCDWRSERAGVVGHDAAWQRRQSEFRDGHWHAGDARCCGRARAEDAGRQRRSGHRMDGRAEAASGGGPGGRCPCHVLAADR